MAKRNSSARSARTEAIGIRVTKTERDAWNAAAKADGRTLSAWIARRCNGDPTVAPTSKQR